MSRRKGILILLVTAVIVAVGFESVMASGTQEGAQQPQGEMEAPEVVLTVGTIYPPEQPASVAINWAVDQLDERTNGRITIEHHHSGTLGSNPELADQLVSGALDINVQSLSYFEGDVPEVAIDGAFFLYDNWEHVERAWGPDGAFGNFFREEVLDVAGVRILVPWNYGRRVITTGSIAVRHPDDLEGVKIRAPGAPIWLDQVASWGASATPVAFPELYLALSQGVVEGQENPISVIYANKFHEVQDYMSLTNHKINLIYVLFNEEAWQSLSSSDQELIRTVFNEAIEVNESEINRLNEVALEEFRAAGGTVIEDPDREAFRERVMTLYAPGGKYEHLGEMRELAEEAAP